MTVSPGRALVLSYVTHAEFLRWVIGLAKRQGWRIKVDHDSRKEDWQSDSGWPDLVALRGKRIVTMECKVGRDKLKPEQLVWQTAFRGAGAEAYCVRPEHEESIRQILE